MINRLPASIFVLLGMLLLGMGLLPLLRALVGVDQTVMMSFLNVMMFCISGLMTGLSGMILLIKRQPNLRIVVPDKNVNPRKIAIFCHASGLLLYTGLPFANFLLSFWLWTHYRHHSAIMEQHGKQAVTFQVSIYLYIMLTLFLVFITFGFGVFLIPVPIIFHLTCTLLAIIWTWRNKRFQYPANLAF